MADAPVVLITGATSGLGRYLAAELAGSGGQVLAHGRDPERVADLCTELGRDAHGYVTVNCLHPATLMGTAMVTLAGITPVSTVEEGGEATMRLIADPALDGVTGQFFNGLKASRALPEAYDPRFRARLGEVTDQMLGADPGMS